MMEKGAVLGLRHGARHVEEICSFSDWPVVVEACDISSQRLLPFRGNPQIRCIETWKELSLDSDFAIVSLPNHLHVPALNFLLRRNRKTMLFCEKPLAQNVEEAICLAKKAKGTHIQIIHELRLNPIMQTLQQRLSTHPPSAIELRWMRDSMPRASWYFNHKSAGGGVLMDLGVHLIDLVQFLLGTHSLDEVQIKHVTLEIDTDTSIEYAAQAQFYFGEILISLDVGWKGKKSDTEIILNLYADDKIETYISHSGSHRVLHAPATNKQPLVNWIEQFLRGDKLPFPQFDEALATLKLIERLYHYAVVNSKSYVS